MNPQPSDFFLLALATISYINALDSSVADETRAIDRCVGTLTVIVATVCAFIHSL